MLTALPFCDWAGIIICSINGQRSMRLFPPAAVVVCKKHKSNVTYILKAGSFLLTVEGQHIVSVFCKLFIYIYISNNVDPVVKVM